MKKSINIVDNILLILSTLLFGLFISVNDKNLNYYFIVVLVPVIILYSFIRVRSFNKTILKIWIIVLVFVIYYFFQDLFINCKLSEGLTWWFLILIYLPVFYLYSKKQIEKSIKLYFCVSLIIFFVDLIYRFYFNINVELKGFHLEIIFKNFYLYKKGLIGGDTNTTGIVASLLYVLSIILIKKNNKIKYIFFIFIILTFSRSAIIASIGVSILEKITRVKRVEKKIGIIIFFIILGILGVLLLVNDKSGKTKILFITEGIKIFSNLSVDKIFFGLKPDEVMIGKWYPHLIVLVMLLYKGIIGLILYFSIMGYLFFKIKNLRLIILLLLIEGCSYLPISLPTISYVIIIILILEIKKYKIFN